MKDQDQGKICVVIDLDETLVHSSFKVRNLHPVLSCCPAHLTQYTPGSGRHRAPTTDFTLCCGWSSQVLSPVNGEHYMSVSLWLAASVSTVELLNTLASIGFIKVASEQKSYHDM